MENEEKKDGCCEGKEKCEHGINNCCHNWKKCHMIKWIVIAIALIIAFCFGTQWGEMKSQIRGSRFGFERGGMMNWSNEKADGFKNDTATGSVTVQVKDAPEVTPKQ
jgi:hypothetical protein